MPPRSRPVILSSTLQAGRLLRERREALGLAPEEVAATVGVSPTRLRSAEERLGVQEKGQRWLTQNLLDWAQALGLAVVLMEGEHSEEVHASSDCEPMTLVETRASPGRTTARTPVRQRTLTFRIVFQEPL